jgi:hypothetical protein
MIDIPTLIDGYLAANVNKRYYAHGATVLKRIAADRRAHVAIYGIAKQDADQHQIWKILALCIDAEHRLRTFQSLLASERDNAKQLQQHRQSVADLRQFIDQAMQGPDNPTVNWLPIATTEVEHAALYKQRTQAAYRHSAEFYQDKLDCIAELIELRQQASDDAAVEIGVTRKSRTDTAAATAALGWFAEGVERRAGKPCVPQVATLAEIALGIGEVTPDRVRAARKRRI